MNAAPDCPECGGTGAVETKVVLEGRLAVSKVCPTCVRRIEDRLGIPESARRAAAPELAYRKDQAAFDRAIDGTSRDRPARSG